MIRRPVTQAQLRAELAERLPFDTEIMICQGREVVRLMSRDPFAGEPVRPDIVRFASFGVPATTRNWNTMTAIAKALGHEGT